jgi:hypothetical protein
VLISNRRRGCRRIRLPRSGPNWRSRRQVLLCVLTVVWGDWIEEVVRVDPDRGSAWLEWSIVIASLVVSLRSGALARSEWRLSAGKQGPMTDMAPDATALLADASSFGFVAPVELPDGEVHPACFALRRLVTRIEREKR